MRRKKEENGKIRTTKRRERATRHDDIMNVCTAKVCLYGYEYTRNSTMHSCLETSNIALCYAIVLNSPRDRSVDLTLAVLTAACTWPHARSAHVHCAVCKQEARLTAYA